ncbi:MAG: RNA methyltransferase [Candidatus Magasanikbacteria bacterium]|jgi:23S rRNA (guanosine2251-2'-O)-methyltransferase|nr:RNA methyltransferase [Candidatus Magasanikbacteria bacterium]MBT4220875.1 RNA methyltransferase [Candidatus Magasanikbacteria bacterium]MBT4541670.1 RNA methyltransferase [Candidatus Magasanikbacteria bacterium]MBT6252804.1 RNA methyltransferase [Candidatus Magasanikbacteria bacterium]MBT6334371.1 RNA methyltransferase [Candidatus Magasanikbacteria bacterium]
MKKEKYLVLPNIRSCHNVGAMFRTADACGFTKLFLCGYTATPPKPQIDKVSLGAETWVPWEKEENVKALCKRLKKEGVTIIALEKNSESIPLREIEIVGSLALIVGNEVDGITEDILEIADVVAHIPMHGKKESLNVSIAAGIAMYEISQKED